MSRYIARAIRGAHTMLKDFGDRLLRALGRRPGLRWPFRAATIPLIWG
jgi:hypothetical protein